MLHIYRITVHKQSKYFVAVLNICIYIQNTISVSWEWNRVHQGINTRPHRHVHTFIRLSPCKSRTRATRRVRGRVRTSLFRHRIFQSRRRLWRIVRACTSAMCTSDPFRLDNFKKIVSRQNEPRWQIRLADIARFVSALHTSDILSLTGKKRNGTSSDDDMWGDNICIIRFIISVSRIIAISRLFILCRNWLKNI